ncbi:MAG: hypothetical protein WA117_06785 [Verrucomicrobiia bacterium]
MRDHHGVVLAESRRAGATVARYRVVRLDGARDSGVEDRPGRVTELTRMLGGQSDAARKHAESLLT